jgi:hypothetical protein
MSSVGGVGGQSSLLVQQLGRLATDRVSTDETRKAQIETAAKKAGVDLGAIEGLRDKVQSAVETALKENQGKSQSDTMQAVQTAIDQTLEDSGVDPEELQSQLTALQSQMPQGMQGTRGGPPPGGPPPGGPPPGGPPQGAGSTTSSTSTTTDDETTSAIQTLLDSSLSLEEILQQLMEAAEERARSSSESTTETGAASAVQGATATTTSVSSDTASAIQQLLSSDASFEDILQQLVSQRDQQANEQSRIERLANVITASLFGPALDTYA